MDNELGNRIKQLRQQADLTQAELARILDVSPALISAYELGDRSPRLETLASLAILFKVSTDYLLGIKGQSTEGLDGLSSDEAQAIQTIVQSLRVKRS